MLLILTTEYITQPSFPNLSMSSTVVARVIRSATGTAVYPRFLSLSV
jgi:hypothetical protein